MPLCRTLLLLTLFGLPGTASSSERVTLEVSLDASEYVVGQPIMALVSVRNDGDTLVEDIGPIDPRNERLQFEILREGDTAPLSYSGDLMTVAFSEEGLRLLPGQEECEMLNLLDFFGTWPSDEDWLVQVLWQRSLPPGDYRVRASFLARTGVRRDLRRVVVRSEPVSFRVLPNRAADEPRCGLEELRRSSKWRPNYVTPEQQEACRTQLERLVDSPYFLLAFRCGATWLSDEDLITLVARLRNSPHCSRWWPAMVWHIASRPLPSEDLRVKELNGLGPFERASWEQRIVDAWRLRLQQKRYYYSR